MTDPFEGSGLGPGEAANEGFKIFGLSVNQFSAAVAGLDALTQGIKRTAKNAAKERTASDKTQSNIAKEQASAAKKQAAAAESNKDLAKKASKHAEKQWKNQKKQDDQQYARWNALKSVFAKMAHVANNFKESVNKFKDSVAERAKKAREGFLGGISGSIKEVVNVVKQFAGRFFIVFTIVNLLTRVLQRLLEINDANRRGFRAFGRSGPSVGDLAKSATDSLRTGEFVVSAEQAEAIARGFNQRMRDSSKITGQLVANVSEVARALNMDAAQGAKFLGVAMRENNATAMDFSKTFAGIANIADKLGLTIDELANDIANNVALAQQFNIATEQGRVELYRAAASARLLGTDLGEVRAYGDQFFDLDTAMEAAARAQAFGVSISARERVVGAMSNDPSKLLIKTLEQLNAANRGGEDLKQSTFGGRLRLDRLLKGMPELGAVFQTIEDLETASQAVARGDLDKVKEMTEKSMKYQDMARAFESKSLEFLDKLVVQGETIEQRLNNMADKIADKIAGVLQPFFTDVVNQLERVIGLISRIIDWISSKFPGEIPLTRAEQASLSDSTAFMRQQVEYDIKSKSGMFADGDVSQKEIDELTKASAERLRKSGMNISEERLSEELIKALKSTKNLGALQFNDDGPVRIRVESTDGRALTDLIIQSRKTGVGIPGKH